MPLTKLVKLVHEMLGRVLVAGDAAIDATVGRGQDTCVLAELVGPTGRVIGFDLQEDALASATRRLDAAGLTDRVTLVSSGHEHLAEWLREHHPEIRPRAVVFNLGYLPRGDKSITTRPETTIPALDAALDVLAPGGRLFVVVYPGHEGGQREADAVLDWAMNLPSDRAEAAWYQPTERESTPPLLIAAERL
jgi:16S rRNA C1402 N4-methylase RsmH